MHDQSRSSSGGAIAAVILLLALIVLLVLVGFGAGFIFMFRTMTPVPPPSAPMMTAVPSASTTFGPPSFLRELDNYPLATADIKDTLEAPVLTIGRNKNVYLAFASQTGDKERTLYFTRSTDGGRTFATPRALRKTTIFLSQSHSPEGKQVKRPIRLVPQLVIGGDTLYLGWLEPNVDNSTVLYYVAQSTDNGETFSEPMQVHESSGARPTFTSLAADSQGNLAATWLDHRAGVQQPFASIRLADKDKFDPEVQVYASTEEQGVCPCCPTASIITPDGRVIVAFRNQLDGYRDIYVAEKKLTDEAFGPAQRVVDQPTWKFDGCPHDGPSLVTDGKSLFVGWMDAHTGTPRCYVASRSLEGGVFSAPESLNIATNESQGNIKLCLQSPTALLAVWEENVPTFGGASPSPAGASAAAQSSRHIHTAWKATDNSGTWTPAERLQYRDGVFQSRATVTGSYPQGPFVAWNELDNQGKKIVLGEIMHPAFPFLEAPAP